MEFMIKRTSIWMRSRITSYLKQHNLYFEADLMEGIPRITMVFKNCDRCPDYITEGCIWFYEDFITAAFPGLLDDLSTPVFLLLEGRITAEEAIDMVRSDIIGERGRM